MDHKFEHLHFDECESTQLILRDKLDEGDGGLNFLITSNHQISGRGRSGNNWESVDNSIAMSFIIDPSPELTLTSLELGVLTCLYFERENLCLKWPNDILNSKGMKCAGILCQTYQGRVLVGLGLNYGTSPILEKSHEFKFGRSFITDRNIKSSEAQSIAKDLYLFIINNRLDQNSTIRSWNHYCTHIDKSVEIKDNGNSQTGTFKGIGSKGEALLDNKGTLRKIYSGSLFLG